MIEMRYATADDYAVMHNGMRFPFTMTGFALVEDGEPIALACLRHDRASPYLVGSLDIADKAKRKPKTLHAFAKRVLQAASDIGTKSFVVVADKAVPRSEAWIKRLGFKQIGEIEQGEVYQWQR